MSNRSNRWAYMGLPHVNPPNNDCPECTEPSKTHFIGGKTVEEDGKKVAHYTWKCQHGHGWLVKEIRSGS